MPSTPTADAGVPALLTGPFPHEVGDGVHAHVRDLLLPGDGTRSGAEPESALVIDLRGDATADDFADEDFLDEMAREGYVPYEGAFRPVAVPETVPGRVWASEDDVAVPGIAWQSTGGQLTIVLFPGIADASVFDEWLHVDDDWLGCLFPALFAPSSDAYVWADDPHPAVVRTAEEMTTALASMDAAATLLGSRRDDDAWTLGVALSLLGWAGAGQPGALTPALIERHGAAAGRYAFEWHRRGYTEADRVHFTEWLTEEDELLLWRHDGGTRLETLTRWLDGADPALHGMDSAVLVHTVLASCRWDSDEQWTAEKIRRTYDRGLTNPNWWHVFGVGYLRERPDPTLTADGEVDGLALIDYVLDWAEVMPLDVAVWYIAHQTPRAAAAAAFADGGFSPDAFLTLWALAPVSGWDEAAYQRECAQEPGWAISHGLLVPVPRTAGHAR